MVAAVAAEARLIERKNEGEIDSCYNEYVYNPSDGVLLV
jgi:hypothetical protein